MIGAWNISLWLISYDSTFFTGGSRYIQDRDPIGYLLFTVLLFSVPYRRFRPVLRTPGSDTDAAIRPGSPPELCLHLFPYAASYFWFLDFFLIRQALHAFFSNFQNWKLCGVVHSLSCTLYCAWVFERDSKIWIFQIDKKFVELWNYLGHQMSTASRDTLLQVFQDKTNRILTPVVNKVIEHSTKGTGFKLYTIEKCMWHTVCPNWVSVSKNGRSRTTMVPRNLGIRWWEIDPWKSMKQNLD